VTDAVAHDHDFGPVARRLTAQMCRAPDCTEWAVSTGKRWRDPTTDERVTIVERMMYEVSVAEAMVIVHGQAEGMRRARMMLGMPEHPAVTP
jgi:hypothetical protein